MKIKKLLTITLSTCVMLGAACLAVACSKTEEDPRVTVRFNVNTEFATNTLKDKSVLVGKRVSKPSAYIIDENPDNLQVYGWYTDPACTDPWDFKKDRVEKSMTLYAKWVELYEVNYYLNGELTKTEPVFNGDYIEEDPTIAEGYKYLGTFADEEFTTLFDYESPITASTNIYVQRSQGLYLSDGVSDGELSSGTLSDYLAAYIGSWTGVEEEGWVENYTVTTGEGDDAVEEDCTYVNFGYAPVWGDPYVELSRSFNISESQIIRVWFKNLGNADSLCMFFTAMLDEDTTYSETGAVYHQDFCWPNYTGSNVPPVMLTESQRNMSESDDWTYVDFNLYEIEKYGYSIWGTSSFLGSLRFQTGYKNTSEDDWSNVFLIKAIEGIPYDVKVQNSATVTKAFDTAKGTASDKLDEVAETQLDNPNGFVFPKDRANVGGLVGPAELAHGKEGIYFLADNEVACRNIANASSGFSIYAGDKNISLDTLTTFNVTLRNFGYATTLIAYIYNDNGVPIKTSISIAERMASTATYTLNLYGQFGMSGKLDRVEFLYDSLGVDNMLLIESVSFSDFVAYDINGINFNDKACLGLVSNDKVTVSFNSGNASTQFKVLTSGAIVETPAFSAQGTTDGYASAELSYRLPKDSNVTAVKVEYKIGGVFTTPYVYNLDVENKGVMTTLSLPFVTSERGKVQALRLTFEGTGTIQIKKIAYQVGEMGIPFYKSYGGLYNSYRDWLGYNTYEYDSATEKSTIVFTANGDLMDVALYIGYSTSNEHSHHTTTNPYLSGKAKVKYVYQNQTSVDSINIILSYDKNEFGPGDGSGIGETQFNGLTIDANMKTYEWSTLTVEVPVERLGFYLAKVRFQFSGNSISLRAISVEIETEGGNV